MKKVGRYVIISELGRGAMGVVYKASDPTIDREVALKVLSLSSTNEEGTNSPQEMFMREVRAAGRLAHPSIVTIYDAFDDSVNQTSCIVMELVPGMTLEKILESGKPPTIEQALDLIRQVAEALDYAHRNKVIHRDLKPANILVAEDGRAKITDFGIAKVLAREGVARTIGIMGTPSYMSPEQVRGGDIDARTDIFSLGIMMFTMFTGQKPFSGNTAAVMFKIVYEEPSAPSLINPHLTPAFDFVVKKCLAKDRAQRYPSVRDLLLDVDDLQHGRSPRSHVEAPEVAAPPPPVATTPEDQTVASAKSSANPPGSRPQPPRMPPPPTPLHQEAQPSKPVPPLPAPPAPTPRPAATSATDPTVAMANPAHRQSPPLPHPATSHTPPPPAPIPPPQSAPPAVDPLSDAQPLMGKTLVMRVPDLAASSHPSASQPAPTTTEGAPLMGRTLPMRVPDLSAVSTQAPAPPLKTPAPLPPAPPSAQRTPPRDAQVTPAPVAPRPVAPPPAPPQKTVPLPLPDFAAPAKPAYSPPPQVAVAPPPRPAATVPPPVVQEVAQADAGSDTIRFDDVPAPAPDHVAHKSKVLPILVGVAALLFFAVAGMGFWMFHHTRNFSHVDQTAQVQPPVPVPPPVAAPVVTPPPGEQPAAAATPQVTPPPQVTKKSVAPRKMKPTAAPRNEPAPAPVPAVVTPPPAPEPSGPTPAEIARAAANAPRIINVVCNFALKEANFTFSGGGKTIFQETQKGKKKKSGFLGIKGSFEGTFSHTLTVPAGVSQISLHVESKDGSTDVSNAAKIPPAGGFVPTLDVKVDSDHLTLTWKSGP